MSKLYIDYDTHIDIDNMKRVCKSASIYGKGVLECWKLTFRFLVTIDKDQDGKLPVLVWNIDDEDEKNLDECKIWEDSAYRKEYLKAKLDTDEIVEGLVYILNIDDLGSIPKYSYLSRIYEGYRKNKFDIKYLREAYRSCGVSEEFENKIFRRLCKSRKIHFNRIYDLKDE